MGFHGLVSNLPVSVQPSIHGDPELDGRPCGSDIRPDREDCRPQYVVSRRKEDLLSREVFSEILDFPPLSGIPVEHLDGDAVAGREPNPFR